MWYVYLKSVSLGVPASEQLYPTMLSFRGSGAVLCCVEKRCGGHKTQPYRVHPAITVVQSRVVLCNCKSTVSHGQPHRIPVGRAPVRVALRHGVEICLEPTVSRGVSD